MSKDGRYQHWRLIVYPESAPENWRDIIDECLTPWYESPLHDQDLEKDGKTLKKPHWHLVLSFGGKKSYSQIKEICDRVNGPIPKAADNVAGAIRYLVHLDHKEKAQYPISSIVTHCGADINNAFAPTNAERYECFREMCRYVIENNVVDYFKFEQYCYENRYDDWYRVLCDRGIYHMSTFIKSRWQYAKNKAAQPQMQTKQMIDPETGEMTTVFIPNKDD